LARKFGGGDLHIGALPIVGYLACFGRVPIANRADLLSLSPFKSSTNLTRTFLLLIFHVGKACALHQLYQQLCDGAGCHSTRKKKLHL
jgi:hypothetical protein